MATERVERHLPEEFLTVCRELGRVILVGCGVRSKQVGAQTCSYFLA